MQTPHLLPAVVLDIEGTTSSTWFVHDTLYPYSRAHFERYIVEHASESLVEEQLEAVRQLIDEPDADRARIVEQLNAWLDADEKVTPLKALQGWIWRDGFAKGELTSHFFDDAIPAIRQWHDEGRTLFIFSSGSVTAQHAWFGHSPDGDLLPLFTDHFDTENIGPKRIAASYAKISAAIGFEPAQTIFLSDLVAELDAAREAGWNTVGVQRAGDQHFDKGVGDHLAISAFDQLDLGQVPPTRVA